MNKLIEKYRTNKLTHEELLLLREQLSSASDREIADELERSWQTADNNEDGVFTHDDISRIKRDIDAAREKYCEPKTNSSFVIKLLRRVSVILIPLLLATTLYFYRESEVVKNDVISVATAKGEKATVTLPDGSRVTLNSSSQLRYRAADFNGSERHVNFSGEAYFEVAKKNGKEFFVDGVDFCVKVLGTRFNLNSYTSSPKVTVTLDEGSVLFSSLLSGKNVTMKAGDFSTLNRSTGDIYVERIKNPADVTAWKRNEIVARKMSFAEMLDKLSNIYDISFVVTCNLDSACTFTGVLPTDNLNEALDIVEQLYDLNIKVDGKKVIIRKGRAAY